MSCLSVNLWSIEVNSQWTSVLGWFLRICCVISTVLCAYVSLCSIMIMGPHGHRRKQCILFSGYKAKILISLLWTCVHWMTSLLWDSVVLAEEEAVYLSPTLPLSVSMGWATYRHPWHVLSSGTSAIATF